MRLYLIFCLLRYFLVSSRSIEQWESPGGCAYTIRGFIPDYLELKFIIVAKLI